MRHLNPLAIRMSDRLKEALEAAALERRRSLNAELVHRLEDSFRPPLTDYPATALVAELIRRKAPTGIDVRVEIEGPPAP